MLARAMAAVAGLVASAAAFGSGVTFTPVLVTGQQAPGLDPGVTFAYVGLPIVGDGGHVALDSYVTGPGIQPGQGGAGYRGMPGSLSTFYRGGSPVPSMGPDVFFNENTGGFRCIPNSSGDFLFVCLVHGAGVSPNTEEVLFMHQGGTTSALFRQGSSYPAFTGGEVVNGGYQNASQDARILDNGSLLARLVMTGGPGGTVAQPSLLAGPLASPTLPLLWGASPPGCPETFTGVAYYSNLQNHFSPAGKFIATGVLADAPETSNDALWTGDSSGATLWLREGSGLPGIDPANVVVFALNDDSWYSINDAGQALAALRLQTGLGDTLSTNDRILVHGTPGNLSVIARENGQVPGMPMGVLYEQFYWSGVYNGGVVIAAFLRGDISSANDQVILGGAPGALSVLMREGDQAPGFPGGSTFGELSSINGGSVRMNKNGHGFLLVPVQTSTGTVRALYAFAPGAAPQLVVTWNSVLEVAPGDFRIVKPENFSIYDNESNINVLGQIGFQVEFTDGSFGAMIANVSFAPGASFAQAAAPTIADSAGNGDGTADPAESMIGLTIPVRNDGTLGATGVTAVLTSLTPTVTVQTANAAYANLASGATGGNAAPFVISVSPAHPCGSSALFRLHVTSSEGESDITVLVPTGSNYPGCAAFTAGAVAVSDSSGNGNGNGIAEPGESSIALSIPVTKSSGAGTSTGVSATLTTTTPTASIVSGTAAYPNIAAAATQSNSTPFVISLSPSHPCGAPVNLHLSLTADGGLGSAELDFSINGGVPAAATPFARTAVGAGIPDNDANGVSVNFTVSGVNVPVSDVNFRFDGTSGSSSATQSTTGLGHANIGDLVISLTSPGGITVVLADHPGPDSSANNLRQCTFDDAAASSIQNIGSPAGPISGSFQPLAPLSVFNGLSGAAVNGTWVLKVADTVESIGGVAGGQGGFVRNASLIIGNAAVCVSAGCAADFNGVGGVTIDDLFLYLNAYFQGMPSADFNGVGGVTIDDLFLYINAYFVGC